MHPEVVNLTQPIEILSAWQAGKITREAAIGALVQGGWRTVRQAKRLLDFIESYYAQGIERR
jgi:hypothetical protein